MPATKKPVSRTRPPVGRRAPARKVSKASLDASATHLANLVRGLRHRHGLTQVELAQRATVTRDQVVALENGVNVRLHAALAVLRFLGVQWAAPMPSGRSVETMRL